MLSLAPHGPGDDGVGEGGGDLTAGEDQRHEDLLEKVLQVDLHRLPHHPDGMAGEEGYDWRRDRTLLPPDSIVVKDVSASNLHHDHQSLQDVVPRGRTKQ